jgi:hypothetical protein
LKSWKSSLTCSIVSFKHNVGQLFVRVETEAEDKNRLYLAGVYQEFVTQVFYHFLKLNPHTKKVLTRHSQKTKEKKKFKFCWMSHFVTSKPSHVWISNKQNELEAKKRKSTKTNSCCFFF